MEFLLNNHQRKVKIDCKKIVAVLEKSKVFFPAPPSQLEITLISDKKIKELNKKFLHKNTSTDILSFKLSREYGEIIISVETAAKNAVRYGITTEYEIIYLIIHGYLHIRNYTDYTEKERERMFEKQDRIFNKIVGRHKGEID